MSAVRAARLVRRLGARVVVGTGGYLAAPAIVGGWLARRPVLLLEPNAQAGVANRQLSRLAREAVLAYPSTAAMLHCPATVTGVPVRAAFFETRGDQPQEASKDRPLRLLVLGGSQGAAQLNRLMPRALARLEASSPDGPWLRVLHQAGPKHLDATREAYAAVDLPGIEVEVTTFLDDMPGAMHEHDVAVSRAGAITLAELCAAGLPSLLVPLALAGGHQRDNALALAAAGGALVADEELTDEALAAQLGGLLIGPDAAAARLAMASAARGLARGDAAAAIVDRVEALAEAA